MVESSWARSAVLEKAWFSVLPASPPSGTATSLKMGPCPLPAGKVFWYGMDHFALQVIFVGYRPFFF